MADEKVKENVAPSETKKSKEVFEKEKGLRGELGKLDKKNANHSIDETLKKVPDIIKERMKEAFEKFKEEKGIEVEKEEDLTDEQKKEFKEYTKNIPQEVFEETRDKVIEISGDRLTQINEIQKKAYELKEIVDAELEERNAELSKIKDENSNEYIKLKEEIAKIKNLQEDLDPKGEERTNVFGQLNRATDTQKTINAHAYAGMIITFEDYPQVKVTSDPKLNKDILENSREKGYNKQVEDNTRGNDGQVAPQGEKGENQRVVPVQGGNQQQVKSAKAPAGVAQNFVQGDNQQQVKSGIVPDENAQNFVPEEEQTVVQEDPKELSNLDLLGYNPNNILDFDSSVELLKKFADGDLTDKQRLEMLNDPECKDVIIQALEQAGKVRFGERARMFDETRSKLLQLSKGPMMLEALKEHVETLNGNVEDVFNNFKKEYEDRYKELNERLDEEPDNEKIKQELVDLDKEYESIKNVSDYKKATKKIEKMRTKLFNMGVIGFNSFKRGCRYVHSVMFNKKEVKEITAGEDKNKQSAEEEKNKQSVEEVDKAVEAKQKRNKRGKRAMTRKDLREAKKDKKSIWVKGKHAMDKKEEKKSEQQVSIGSAVEDEKRTIYGISNNFHGQYVRPSDKVAEMDANKVDEPQKQKKKVQDVPEK